MAIKLTKTETNERDAHVSTLRDKWAAVQLATEAAQEQINLAVESVNVAIRDYNEALSQVESWRDDIANRLRGEYDDRSDAWRDSDRGQSVDEFVSGWENISLTEATELDAPSIEVEEPTEVDDLENVETEPE